MALQSEPQHYPTKSVAQLAEKAKVTGWEQPQSNAIVNPTGRDDELTELSSAQVVTINKDEFVPQQEEQVQLQQGPPKTYIDIDQNKTQQLQSNDNKQVSFNNNNNNEMTDSLGTSTMDTLDDGTHPNNRTMISLPDIDNNGINEEDDDEEEEEEEAVLLISSNNNISYNSNDINSNDNNNNNIINYNNINNIELKESKEQEETVLSVWQAKRREELLERAKKERETINVSQEQAQEDLKEFNQKRMDQIDRSKKDALDREASIREDYESVHKFGTVWQQVAKMIDLTLQEESIERMRNLILKLKNEGDKQNSNNNDNNNNIK